MNNNDLILTKDQIKDELENVNKNTSSIEYDYLNELKDDLNNFLFQRVPGKMTISQFEALSVTMHAVFIESVEQIKEQTK